MTSNKSAPASSEAIEQMLYLLNGHCLEQALYVAAVLGIADLLNEGSKSIEELAMATEADRLSLYRLLRTLSSIGVFCESPSGHFALTPLGGTLRSDAANTVRDRAIYYGAPEMWSVWGNLLYSVRTGQSACEHIHAMSFYDHLSCHPNVGVPFDRYMAKTSEQHNAAVLESYDFSSLRTLVDIGGGLGSTLAAILQAYPTLKGILFDLPQVVERATDNLSAAGVEERCKIVGGDMQQLLPAGGDGYLLKWVLMDRSDERAIEVLSNCRRVMAANGKVLAVEMIMPQDDRQSFSKIMDLQMMLLFGGGRIRTEEEFRDLFEAAGLAVTHIYSTQSPNMIIEGERMEPVRGGGGTLGEPCDQR
jgi:precorrin-6B methylase 2